MPEPLASLRIDKWLWAARFYKTRSLATAAIHAGHIKLNGTSVKPARDLRPGDTLELAIGDTPWTLQVLGLSAGRPAKRSNSMPKRRRVARGAPRSRRRSVSRRRRAANCAAARPRKRGARSGASTRCIDGRPEPCGRAQD